MPGRKKAGRFFSCWRCGWLRLSLDMNFNDIKKSQKIIKKEKEKIIFLSRPSNLGITQSHSACIFIVQYVRSLDV